MRDLQDTTDADRIVRVSMQYLCIPNTTRRDRMGDQPCILEGLGRAPGLQLNPW